jgi:predicted double-glycine peptidase
LKYPSLLAALLTVVLLLPAGASATEVPVRLNAYSKGGVLLKKVKSLKEMRQRQMVPQTRDFSCGAAALATIMHYYYGRPVTETDAILGMFKYGNKKKIQKRGFSLLDMKFYANSLKYKAGGFRIKEIGILKKIKIPVITLIETNRYKHFVVIRHTDDRYVYLSDPSWGNRRVTLTEFSNMWPNNVIFAVQGPIVGKPEGLFVEGGNQAEKTALILRKDFLLRNRIALDPTYSFYYNTHSPLVVIPFIPGQ